MAPTTLAGLNRLANMHNYQVTKTDGEYRVAPRLRLAGSAEIQENQAYYTPHFDDALGTLQTIINE